MNILFLTSRRCRLIGTALFLALLLAGCGRVRHGAKEAAYVCGPQTDLRDRVAPVSNKTGTVQNGERVEVLERDRRFVRVRGESGVEGWIEQRHLISQKVFDQFQALARQTQNDPVQSTGVTRNVTNLHVEPGRDTDHLYQLQRGAKVALLRRATVEKLLPGEAPKPAAPGKEAPAKPMEDWWLVHDSLGHAGWLLGRMLDVDVPLDVAQYAEGQRIVAAFVLNSVVDGDNKVAQYLVLYTEPKDGMPFDYNQARIFTWNLKRHRYETAYRERGLNGVLPVTVGKENFDKEGELPVFVLRVRDDSGNVLERKYKLNTPIVRRVLAPGEQKQTAPRPAARPRGRR